MDIHNEADHLTTADDFTADDHRFRTVTALLQLLGPGLEPKTAPQQTNIARRKLKALKQLASVSFLAARSFDVVATMPKLTPTAMTLLLISPSEELGESDEGPVDIIVTQNPNEPPRDRPEEGKRSDGRGRPISRERHKIDLCPTTHQPQLDPASIPEYLQSNRYTPFDIHVQSLATLITYANKTAGGWKALAAYSTAQAIVKIIRRYKAVKMGGYYLESLRDLNTFDDPTGFIPWSEFDTQCVEFAAKSGLVDKSGLPDLYRAAHDSQGFSHLKCGPRGVLAVLQQFQGFLRTMLQRTGGVLVACDKCLKKPNSAEQIQGIINSAMAHLIILHHFAWESPFFTWYIKTYQVENLRTARVALRNAPEREKMRAAVVAYPGNQYDPSELKQDVGAHASGIDDELQSEDSEPGLILDPSSLPEANILDNEILEVDSHEADLNAGAKPSLEWIAWLRLVTSNIHYSKLISSQKRSNNIRDLRMQVVRYPISTKLMMPWRELVGSLFPERDETITICDALLAKFGREKNIISSPNYPFKGRIHCEAMLATLHRISRYPRQKYAEIDPEVFDCVGTAVAVIAPSKRCCPVCASILRLLSQGEVGYDVFGQHGNVYSCALPTGMPEDIRKQLLKEYEEKLKNRLGSWAGNGRRMSMDSRDSKAISDHSDCPPPDKTDFMGSFLI